MARLGKALLLLVFAGVLGIPAYADGAPTTLQITADVTFSFFPNGSDTLVTETFTAVYDLENIGSAPVCTNSAFVACTGGDWILASAVNFSTSGPLGPFTLAGTDGAFNNFFDFNDALGDQIQIEFQDFGQWMQPGVFGGFNVDLSLSPDVSQDGFLEGTGFVSVSALPEPETASLLAIGMFGLLLCASFMTKRSTLN